MNYFIGFAVIWVLFLVSTGDAPPMSDPEEVKENSKLLLLLLALAIF